MHSCSIQKDYKKTSLVAKKASISKKALTTNTNISIFITVLYNAVMNNGGISDEIS